MNRNTIILFAVAVIFTALIIFLIREKNKDLSIVKDGPIIMFGDSLVYGIGATRGNDLASILSRRLGTTVINAGRPGETTESAQSRLVSDVIVKDPGIVIVILGGNDKLRRVPKEETLKNIRFIVTEIRNTGASVILVGISNIAYSNDYGDIARELNVLFVPRLLDLTLGNSELMSDAVHPNDRGYELIADQVELEVRKLL